MSLEKYSVEKLIGKGSYGEVFLAKHKKDKRIYVVKKVSLHKASEKERKAAEQEAKLLSQLRHPNIVSYRESFQGEQGFLFIIMNYCEGGDLYSKLKAQKSTLLDEKQIVEWFVQIAMALQYMHEKHILHRDLKTQNIFLTRSKIIKLGDLGIAKILENSSDMATTLIGTPYYMSPELFSNRPYNHKSDVWALGCCLYEMCTLRHAFNAKDMSSLVYKILKGKTPPLPKQYSADLCSIIKNMLDQDPDKRPSVSRLLRHPYIKKQIAAFLEGTKNRQKQRSNSAQKKIVEITSRKESQSSSSITVKSDSDYSESGLQSIATVSGVDCVIEDPNKPAQKPSVPLINIQNEKYSRSHSENDATRMSTESSPSNGPSEKEQTEINMGNRNEIMKKKEREREVIRKQMAQRRKSASEKPVTKDRVVEIKVKHVVKEESHVLVKKSVRQVRSAGSSRTPANEAKPVIRSRPLPQPPVTKPKTSVNEAPLSRSPRARRRYKIGSRSHSIEGKNNNEEEEEEEEEDDDDKSTASVDSNKSSQSVSDSSKLTARERRRLKQSLSGSPIHRSSDSYNTPPLPSPLEIRNRKSQERASKETPRSSVTSSTPQDSVDGPPRKAKLQIESESSEDDSNGSDLEEISMDEPVKPRKRQNSEVSSLISALDSTLKLDDKSADRVSPEIEDNDQDNDEVSRPTGASPNTSGRFHDRLERLKIDCLNGIGEEMLHRACNIINSVSDDEVEDELVKYMGRDNFDKYGGSIWQLNFYDHFQKS